MGDVKRWVVSDPGCCGMVDLAHLRGPQDREVFIAETDHAREVEVLLQERDAADAAVAKLEKLVEGQELMVISVEGDLAKSEARAVDADATNAKLERRIAEMDRGSGMVGWVEEV